MNQENNTTKEQDRSELHRAIWQIANDLRAIRRILEGDEPVRLIDECNTAELNENKETAKVLKKQKRDLTSLDGYIGVNIKSREAF